MGVKVANNATSTIVGAISSSDVGITVAAGTGALFPALGAGDYFYATLVSAGGTREITKVTARAGDAMTIVRGQEGTTAQSFAAGSRLELRVTAASITDMIAEHDQASEIAFTPTGSIAATNVQAAIAEVVTDLAASGGAALIGYTSVPAIYTQRRLDDYIAEFGLSVFDSQDVRTAWKSGTNSASAVLSEVLLRAEQAATANGERSLVRFPYALRENGAWVTGKYLLKGGAGTSGNPGELRLRDNLIVDARGALFAHDPASEIGHMLCSRGAQNTDWYGGVFDAQGAVNCNPIAVSWRDPFYGAQRNSEKLRFFDIVAKNAKHGGSHLPDPIASQYIGRGGGKPFSVQNGAEDILFANCNAYDCDLGIDLGGIISNDRWAQNIRMTNIYLENIRYMGIFAGSASSGTPTAGAALSATLTNITMRGVGTGVTTDTVPLNVADLFGAITTNGAFGVLIDGLYLENTSGLTTFKRGTNRNCQIRNFTAHIGGQLVNGFDADPFGGDDPRNIDSYGNDYDGTIFLNGASEPTGTIWRNGSTYEEQVSTAEIQVKRHNNNTPAKLSTTKMFTNLHTGNNVQIIDLFDGSIHHAYKNQIRRTPETLTSVADDTVMIYIPRHTDTSILVYCDTGATIHSANIRIRGSRVIAYEDGGLTNFVTGTTILTDGTGDGTDGKYNVHYVAATGIVYFKNRINASRNVIIREAV
jgi:hypothetical protein